MPARRHLCSVQVSAPSPPAGQALDPQKYQPGAVQVAESIIERLQRENAELRTQLKRLRAGAAVARDLSGPEARSRLINSMSPAEIGPHLREVALLCARLSREGPDARAGRALEEISIDVVDRADNLEAIINSPKPTP
jgi:hypothetical protein